MSEVAIKIDHVSKTFKLPHEKQSSIKGAVINVFRGGNRKFERQRVLNDISFDIRKGEFVGIVGRNGSGKSTLLKILASIYAPTKGGVQVNGRLTPFIELGVGFNPELTGRENVYLNGALLGFSRKEMDDMYQDIVEFAELDRFMDQKLKNYSSGMQVRLGFSIAIRANTEILLLDEVLAVGDTAFQQKCYAYFDELKSKKKTIILVTHDMGAVRQFCDRAVLISKGEIELEGTPAEVAAAYERLNYSETQAQVNQTKQEVLVQTRNSKGKHKVTFEYDERVHVFAKWPKEYGIGHVGVVLYKNDEPIFATNSFHKSHLTTNETTLKFGGLGNGRYKVRVGLFEADGRSLRAMYDGDTFTIFNQPKLGDLGEEWEGIIYLENEWV